MHTYSNTEVCTSTNNSIYIVRPAYIYDHCQILKLVQLFSVTIVIGTASFANGMKGSLCSINITSFFFSFFAK